MPEITRKRTGEILRKVFEVLLPHADGLQARTVLEKVAQALTLTEFERGTYPSGGRRFEKLVRFHSIQTVKAGWLTKTKGVWTLTPEGKQAFTRHTDPEEFARQVDKLYRQWAKSQPDEPVEVNEISLQTRGTLEEAEESAWQEIQRYLEAMPPYDFQNLVAALLRAMGYHVQWVAPPGKDGGVDIIAYTDPLGTKPPRIKVQVKRRGDKISVDGVRSFLAVVSDQDVGIFVSMGGFTGDAEAEARTQARRVTLLGLDQLFDLWVEHYAKIAEPDRQLLPLRHVYFLSPE